MQRLSIVIASALACMTLGLSGCGGSDNYDFSSTANNTATSNSTAVFDPTTGNIPQTNDLLFRGQTDGTLNIPTSSTTSAGQLALINTLNGLDGFGLTAPITANFGGSLDKNSVSIGSSVRVFEVVKDVTTQAITSVVRELTAADLLATTTGTNNSTVVLLPLKPLKESTSYLVVLTKGIKGSDGVAVNAASAYLLAKSTTALTGDYAALEPLRQLVNNQETVAANQGVSAATIVLSWSFTTQSVTPVLTATRNLANSATSSIQVVSTPVGKTDTFNTATVKFAGKANVYVGALTSPYYLTAPSSANPTAPLTASWKGANGSFLTRYNPTPVATGTQTIPLLMTIPNAQTMPASGWPVVVFQHGLGRNRTDLLAVADKLADSGFVGIAIDLPLHGVTDSTNPLRADLNPLIANDTERTFNLDLRNNSTGASGPDGTIDPSGTYFINLTSLATARDNIRQGISDILTLRRNLGNIQAVKLDTAKVGYVGMSLGSIVGTGYLATENLPTPASLYVPGGGVARLLEASPTFGSVIKSGLSSAGLQAGTSDYDTFFAVAQTVIDPADPIVLGSTAAAAQPVYVAEVIGDQVIPNQVTNFPLAGTEPLIRVMNLPSVTKTVTNTDGVVRFKAGTHGSLIDPGSTASSAAATAEMQQQMVNFQTSQGATITIQDTSVIQGATP